MHGEYGNVRIHSVQRGLTVQQLVATLVFRPDMVKVGVQRV